MARGGQREGQVGQSYPNRSDLAMASGNTSGHMASGDAGMRGSGTSATEVREQSTAGAAQPPTGQQPAPGPQGPPPGSLTPLDAPGGGGGGMIDNQGRQPIIPRDPDHKLRALYNMTGHPDLLELLERRRR